MNSAQSPPRQPQPQRNSRRETFLAQCAFVVLLSVCVLAFIPARTLLPDRIALLALASGCLFLRWKPLARRVQSSREATAFVLTAAMFIVYSLARSAGPDEGFSLRFTALPDDEFVLPYSAYLVFFGAILTGPYWWFHRLNWTRSLFAGITIIALLSLVSFSILRRYYPTGPTEILDPSSLPPLAMNLVEYACVALLCHAVAIRRQTRKLALRLLPGVLLLLWARHQFMMAPEESE